MIYDHVSFNHLQAFRATRMYPKCPMLRNASNAATPPYLDFG